jgi:hypothetical protein
MFAARVISECACAGSTQFTTTRLCRKMGKRSKANQKTKDQVEVSLYLCYGTSSGLALPLDRTVLSGPEGRKMTKTPQTKKNTRLKEIVAFPKPWWIAM